MKLFQAAQPWEYRWRIAILFLSQPVLAAIYYFWNGSQGVWYAPPIDPTYGFIATLLAGCGLAIRIWGTSFLTAEVVTGLTARNDRLVVGGPFAAIRNPLYVGTLLIFAGFGMFFGPVFAAIFVAVHWLRYGRVIRYEEGFLKQEWGAQFDAYCKTVPRWWPNSISRQHFAGPFATIDGILGNGVFFGMFLGYSASVWYGTLEPLVHFEALGWMVSGIALLRTRYLGDQAEAPLPDLTAGMQLAAQESPAGQSRHAG